MSSGTRTADAHEHAADIKKRLDQLIREVRDQVNKVQDPKAQALFETTAEVIQGLSTAYDHYEHKTEPAWRELR
jgi:hypothetical protein